MGAGANHLKLQAQPINTNTSTTKPKRRKCREVTISSSASAAPQADFDPDPDPNFLSGIFTNTLQAPSNLKDQLSYSSVQPPPPPPMEVSGSPSNGVHNFPSGFTKFNSALTAGLLNPMSPPPSTPPQTSPVARSSPTLFEMMANEPDCLPRGAPSQPPPTTTAAKSAMTHQNNAASSAKDKQLMRQERISEMLDNWSPGNPFNNPDSSDIKLTLTEKDGFSISLDVHRQILVANSAFFAGRLSERWTKHQRAVGVAFEVEIADCEDVEVYVETLRLMYCEDLRRMLIKEDVPKVLGILKISAAIGFDAGVSSCLEYLEAAPWAEDDEEKVTSLLSELRLENAGASDVLKRVSLDINSTIDRNGNDNGEVLIKLLHVILEGKDEKARREMKSLFSKMLRENANQTELRKESLYSACESCLQKLRHHFLQAANSDLLNVTQILRQADNLNWILDILIDRQMAEEFLKTWASQTELSNAHPNVALVHRFEVSRVTARLFIGIGKGQLLSSKDSRYLLLKTWLGPFYDDFGWMRRASKQGLDRHLIEDGLSNMILTLPLSWQQEIFLAWFDRFLNSGEECPNLQRGFESWWRRAFWKRNGEDDGPRLRVAGTENGGHHL